MLFFDIESRSELDIGKVGVWRYWSHPSTRIQLIAWAGIDGPARAWAPPEFRRFADYTRDRSPAIDEFRQHVDGSGHLIAWNAQFDRLGLQFRGEDVGLQGPPALEQFLCAQVAAEAFCYPGKLEKAAQAARVPVKKDPRGKRLINLFADANKPFEPSFEDWDAYVTYCARDVLAMREVWKRCRKLTKPEWEDYWVNERINDIGMPIDVDFAERAVSWADAESESLNSKLRAMTGDKDITMRHHARKAQFLLSIVRDTPLEKDVYTTGKRKGRKVDNVLSSSRGVRDLLRRRMAAAKDNHLIGEELDEQLLFDYLNLLDDGAGVATDKFKAMVNTVHEGRLKAQYRCWAHTGRKVSRGVQIHNLIRKALPPNLFQRDPEIDLIETLEWADEIKLERTDVAARLEEWHGLSFHRILARMLRPTFVAPPGHVLMWPDWSQIEARMLPWLANYAEPALDVFRAYDSGEGPDVYRIAASDIYGVAPDQVTDEQRQIGKVATLSLGFGGGVGAFQAMAGTYGVFVSNAFAEDIKTRWRDANGWAPAFWADLDEAAKNAMRNPGSFFKAGRCTYGFDGSTLYCQLPSGGVLVYPEARLEEVYKEKWDKTILTITHRKVLGSSVLRGELYGGLAAENVVQAEAARLLRSAEKKLQQRSYEHGYFRLIGSTHDEAILEVEESREKDMDQWIEEAMVADVGTSHPGLPVATSTDRGPYYVKR